MNFLIECFLNIFFLCKKNPYLFLALTMDDKGHESQNCVSSTKRKHCALKCLKLERSDLEIAYALSCLMRD